MSHKVDEHPIVDTPLQPPGWGELSTSEEIDMLPYIVNPTHYPIYIILFVLFNYFRAV